MPAVVISPLIQKNTIDHTSVLKTLQNLFKLDGMTARDKQANSLVPLLTLKTPRDPPPTLPDPFQSDVATVAAMPKATDTSANYSNLPGFLHAALKTDLEICPASENQAIKEQFKQIKMQEDARIYMNKVHAKAGID